MAWDPHVLAALLAAGAPVLCKRCKAIVDAETAVRPVVKGGRCVHVDYQSGPFADLVIKAVDGDYVTVGVLGWPDADDGALGRWWPRIMHGRRTFNRGELLMRGM
jgi:hypothetical protein